MAKVRTLAEEAAEERILDVLLPVPRASFAGEPHDPVRGEDTVTRQMFRRKLREGSLDDKEIELEVSVAPHGVEIMAPPGMEEMTNQLQSMFQNLSSDRKKMRKVKIVDARKILREEEAAKLIDNENLKTKAIESVEQNG